MSGITQPPLSRVIVNIDDPWLASLFKPGDERLLAPALHASHPFLLQHRERGGATAFMENGDAVMACGDRVATRRSLPAPSHSAAADESGISWLLAFAAEWALGHVAATTKTRAATL